MKTQEEARAEWCKALRSGEFEQGKGVLAELGDKLKCCCLGVACEVMRRVEGEHALAREERTISRWNGETHEDETVSVYDYDRDGTAFAPKKVMDWLGLNTEAGDFNESVSDAPNETNLVELNDGGKYTFDHIADVIESNPEGLWKTT